MNIVAMTISCPGNLSVIKALEYMNVHYYECTRIQTGLDLNCQELTAIALI